MAEHDSWKASVEERFQKLEAALKEKDQEIAALKEAVDALKPKKPEAAHHAKKPEAPKPAHHETKPAVVHARPVSAAVKRPSSAKPAPAATSTPAEKPKAPSRTPSSAHVPKATPRHEKATDGVSHQRDVDFPEWSSVIGWPVLGIWPPGADRTHVNSAARTHGGSLLVAGDDDGNVCLYNYPAAKHDGQSAHHTYTGHSSHVTKVAVATGDRLVLSAGGKDNSIF
eukprot:Colp12_sorted_trinity150504_noHs@33646